MARADEIAAALSSDHGEQLSAQRTRQAKIVDAARTGTSAAASPGDPDTQLQAAPVRRTPARRRAWLVLAGVLAACAAAVAVVATLRGDRRSVRATPDAPVSANRTPENRTPENRTPENRTPENRTPENRTPEDRTTENRTLGNRATGIRAPAPTWGPFSIDSTPYATIYIDGHALGVTPILQHRLAAGPHQVRAVLRDGREQRVSIDVPAHGGAAPVVLRW